MLSFSRNLTGLRLCVVLAGVFAATAHAQSFAGSTIVLRVSDEYYNFYTNHGGTFAPEGLARAVPGDPKTFLLPVTTDAYPATGGFAAQGSGVVLTLNGVSAVFGDLGEMNPIFRPLGRADEGRYFLGFNRGVDNSCNLLLLNVGLTDNSVVGTYLWWAGDMSPSVVPTSDQADYLSSLVNSGLPIGENFPDFQQAIDNAITNSRQINFLHFQLYRPCCTQPTPVPTPSR